MSDEVSNKVSTTQVASALSIVLVLYNAQAALTGNEGIEVSEADMAQAATYIAIVLSTLYVMWRRTKKSVLKWGLFK